MAFEQETDQLLKVRMAWEWVAWGGIARQPTRRANRRTYNTLSSKDNIIVVKSISNLTQVTFQIQIQVNIPSKVPLHSLIQMYTMSSLLRRFKFYIFSKSSSVFQTSISAQFKTTLKFCNWWGYSRLATWITSCQMKLFDKLLIKL